jgi:hypothetical protein
MDEPERIIGFEAAACPLCDQTVSHMHAMNDETIGALVTMLLSENRHLAAELEHVKRVLAMVGRSN